MGFNSGFKGLRRGDGNFVTVEIELVLPTLPTYQTKP